jgi:hypothetical protein
MPIGGLLGAAFNPASLIAVGFGPAAPLALAVQTVYARVAMTAIQQFGQQMGLPQPMIDMAQAAFAQSAGLTSLFNQNLQQAASGLGIRQFDSFLGRVLGRESTGFQNLRETISNMAQQAGLSPTQQGQVSNTGDRLLETMMNFMRSNAQRDSEGEIAGGNGGGFLARMARALGKLLDNKINRMVQVSEQIGNQGNSNTSQLGELNGELQKLNQEISIISNALNTSLKAVGESQSTLARKQ